MIQYYTKKTFLKGNQREERIAIAVAQKKAEMDTLIERVSQKIDTVSKVNIALVLNQFCEEVTQAVSQGEIVNTPLFSSKYSIKGLFQTSDENFDPEKHQLNVKLTPAVQVREAVDSNHLFKIKDTSLPTKIEDIRDKVTNKVNSSITASAGAIITGENIKIEGEDPRVGVYFTHTETQEEFRVPMSSIITNNPSQLNIITPALTAGTYELKITTQYSKSKTSRVNPVSHILEFDLTVS